MSRITLFAIFGVLFINISCERCMRCRYSYTETVITETPSGEEEEKIEHTDLILVGDDGTPFGDECVKRKEYKDKSDVNIFTIDTYYQIESENTDLENFQYTCTEL